ncbi:3-keto-5-aminohexanoate cleavage protein [Bradyrhizobium manausense]
MTYNYSDPREYLKYAGTSKMPPLIVSAAITGGIQGKEVNPNLPETPEEQALECMRCYNAGASVVHIHARNPDTGYVAPANRAWDYQLVNHLVREKCPDLIIDNTSGGGLGLTLEQRLSSLDARPELSDIDMGPFDIALPLRRREAPLSGRDADEFVDDLLPVTIGETELRARRMADRKVGITMALFHNGHWSSVDNLIRKRLVTPPYRFLFFLGMTSGALPTPQTLLDFVRDAPQPSLAFVMAVGRHDLPLITMATMMGLHAMVGLETNLYVRPGVLATSSAQLVERTVQIARSLGRDIATPAQARAMLDLSAEPRRYAPPEAPFAPA